MCNYVALMLIDIKIFYMSLYIILNTVKADGVGDFSHFEEIMTALNSNPRFRDVDFLLMVLFQTNLHRRKFDSLYMSLLKRVKSLGCPFVFGSLDQHKQLFLQKINNSGLYSQDGIDNDLIQEISSVDFRNFGDLLKSAEQVIIISYDKLFELYAPYFKENVPVKFIAEHDAEINTSGAKFANNFRLRPLGLHPSSYGIKIQKADDLNKSDSINAIKDYAADFFKHMECLGLDFINSIVIPAYFNYDYRFAEFIGLISANKYFDKTKNVVIYHSGSNFNNFNEDYKYEYLIKSILEEAPNFNIKVYSKESTIPTHIFSKPHAVATIYIISGFFVNFFAYKALYKLAPFVAVSGDNSFEMAVSFDKLPIYWPTNIGYKQKTFLGLQTILANISLPNEVYTQFVDFFDLCASEEFSYQDYENVNLSVLSQYWHFISDYIKKHHDFYANLENIIFENVINVEPSDDSDVESEPKFSI